MEKKQGECKNFINLGVVLNNKREVLMIKRAKKEEGKEGAVLEWAFPGGKQKYEESREDCVKREILAETGYDIKPIRQISLRIHPQFLITIVYHLCQLNLPKPATEPSEPHEVAEIKWVKPEKIKELITTDLDPLVAKELGIN
ncbi:MAG: NUDIX hydrolase [Patescibacteria group bacterium]